MRESDAAAPIGRNGAAAAWRNWAGNESARPRGVATPRSADEVADEVRKAGAEGLTVRMTGAGHSFTPAAVTDGVLLRPGGLTGIRSVDAAAGLATVEAGCPLHVLNAELLRRGGGPAQTGGTPGPARGRGGPDRPPPPRPRRRGAGGPGGRPGARPAAR